MKIIEMRTTELVPYENNPRKNDNAVDAVAESIRQFGFKVPIVIDKDNIVVAGHTRLKAAEKLGLKTVPVIRADDLTDEQVQAFRLADNKTAELAGWDFMKLREELAGISGIDMYGLGFENDKNFNIDDFFDVETGEEKKPKLVRCPHCDEWVEVE
ncbi:MAG: ParB N-terminal domain-containing protein [Thermoguttaceae bacterium]|nr:ParB N-terminal domain-containing protein [Thermoguttaceae bacterium]